MTDTTQHDPRDEELARLREQVVAQQARIALIAGTIEAHEIESLSCDRDGEKYCDCLRTLATTDDAAALKAHDDALWNEALTTGIEWQATRGHTLDADDYENELRGLKR